MSVEPKTVLVASRDPRLADVRKAVLEEAGYRVIPATTATEFANECRNNTIDLVLMGYSLPPADKRRIYVEVRTHCKTPVLELHENGRPELVEPGYIFAHRSYTPEDFLEAVNSILRS
jgi:DNA-binding response OmpR family regulator